MLCIRKPGGQLESCPSPNWLGVTEQPWLAVVGSWRRDLVPENSDFWRMDKKSWERVTSVTALHLSSEHSDLSCLITKEAFGNTYVGTCLALLQAHTAAKVPGSEFCNIQLACHLIPPWLRSPTLSESRDVSGSSWESVDPNASHYKVIQSRLHLGSYFHKQKSANWLPIMKCPLFASWKACTTHSLAGCTHQTVKGIEWLCELILTSLQASSRSSGNARRQSANWKLLIWCGWLSAFICLEIRGLQKQHHMHSDCCIPASGRDQRDILAHAKLVCTFSQWLQMLSLKAFCKCMHECLTRALTRTVAGFTKSRLIFFRASFTYKLCDTNSSDLSVWSSFAPFCICTTVPNGLPVLAFADSKRSHCKWIPNDSKPLLKLIRRDAFSANISLPSFHKNWSLIGWKSCTAGIEKTEPWPCPSNFTLRSIEPIDCIRFRVKARVSHHHWTQVKLSIFFCCIRAYTLAPCLHNCFRMSTRNGKGAYPGVFLEVPTRVPPQGSLLDGHVLDKWWKICPRNSAYATNI